MPVRWRGDRDPIASLPAAAAAAAAAAAVPGSGMRTAVIVSRRSIRQTGRSHELNKAELQNKHC